MKTCNICKSCAKVYYVQFRGLSSQHCEVFEDSRDENVITCDAYTPRRMKKYSVDVFFYPYSMICGHILNDERHLVCSMETTAISEKKAENNVRFRFFNSPEYGDNGHPHSQFEFVARVVDE